MPRRSEVEYTPDYLTQADHWAAKFASESIEAVWKAEMLKEEAKDVLAAIMTELKGPEKISEAELERKARSTKKWRDFRNGQFGATKAALEAKVKANNAQRHFESVQSGLSFRRAEFQRLGS